MEWVNENTINLDRELSDLDKFVLDFVSVLRKYSDYVLISGYVAILFGRSRGTEDVDLFMERISEEEFNKLYDDLIERDYWCINPGPAEELFSMLKDNLAIRFARKGEVIPNMEVKFVKDNLDELSLKNKIKVITNEGDLNISKIELQIAYKKFVLKSKKDLEDARYLQKVFNFNDEKIDKYKLILEQNERI
jgi:hypothetical protein